MILEYCKNKEQINQYINFIKMRNKNYKQQKNSIITIIEDILRNKSKFCADAQIMPAVIIDNEEILAVATYIISDRYNEVIQFAFFDALEGVEDAVEILVSEAKKIARSKNINKITFGLNAHINYGLGVMIDKFGEPSTFGNLYTPKHHFEYFEKYTLEKVNMVSYIRNTKDMSYSEKEKKIIGKLRKTFTVRKMNFKTFKKEMDLYTELNNKIFENHPFYFKRNKEEDYELFSKMKPLLKEENMLIAEKDGKPIGYLLWYPDFDEITPGNKEVGIETFIRYKIFKQVPKKFKLMEIGILPEYQNSGAVYVIFDELLKLITKNKHEICESSWILEQNRKSRGFGFKWGDSEHKHYRAYIMHLGERE